MKFFHTKGICILLILGCFFIIADFAQAQSSAVHSEHSITASKESNNTNDPQLFPKSIGSYEIYGALEKYEGDNLFDFINGEAVLFEDYDYINMIVQRYRWENNLLEVQITSYENPLNSFGIYAWHINPYGKFNEERCGGFVESSSFSFYKGNYFVRVFLMQGEDKQGMKTIGCRIFDNLPGELKVPEQVSYFTHEKLVSNSVKYIPKNYLGYEELPPAWEASYQKDSDQYRVYVLKFENSSEAKSAEEMLKESFPHHHILIQDNIIVGSDETVNSIMDADSTADLILNKFIEKE